jgi:hypothetical protein
MSTHPRQQIARRVGSGLSCSLVLYTKALWIDALDLDCQTREPDAGVGSSGDLLSGSRTKLQH